jgi:16S rRNA G527 N7-methylase RsmG
MSQMPDINTIGLTGDRENALAMFDVSRETIERLDRFVELLLAWQRRTNLI